MKFIPVR